MRNNSPDLFSPPAIWWLVALSVPINNESLLRGLKFKRRGAASWCRAFKESRQQRAAAAFVVRQLSAAGVEFRWEASLE